MSSPALGTLLVACSLALAPLACGDTQGLDGEVDDVDSAIATPPDNLGSPINDNDGVGSDDGGEGVGTDSAVDIADEAGAAGSRYLPFRVVTSYLSRHLERRFDVVFLANSASGGGPTDLVKSQNMIMVERGDRGGDLFVRDGAGYIVGFASSARVTTFPISSGLPSKRGILTYSGIFRIDREDSLRKHFTSPNANMSYSMYIDFQYSSGRDAGLAIHGTPPRNYSKLGVQRASEGCLRVRVEDARTLKEKLFDPKYARDNLPKFDIRERLPNKTVRTGQSGTRPGISALIVTFDGF